MGLLGAGSDPTEQFVGSYRVAICPEEALTAWRVSAGRVR
jgi:hypothetical protein